MIYELGIGIANSIFGLALNAFYKTALHIFCIYEKHNEKIGIGIRNLFFKKRKKCNVALEKELFVSFFTTVLACLVTYTSVLIHST